MARLAGMLWCLVVSIGFGLAPTHAADDAVPREVLKQLYNSETIRTELFSAHFLKQVSAERLALILKQLRAQYGAAEKVTGADGEYSIWTKRFRVPTLMTRGPSDTIVQLFFRPGVLRAERLQDVTRLLDVLPGEIAYLVTKNGKDLAARDAEKPLAIASGFKLAVLVALRRKIDAGTADWSDVVKLDAGHRSLPSGLLQEFPAGSPLTLHMLAALMIARSDNTATDALIDVVGREIVEEVADIAPLLTTREVFQFRADPELYERYANAELESRRAILAGLKDRPLPPVYSVLRPFQRQAEWLMPLRSSCQWMDRLRGLELMSINPGLVGKSGWDTVMYKGGSEVGVLHLTTWLSDGSHAYCVAVTWNRSEALDNKRLFAIYTNLTDVLKRQGVGSVP